VYANRGCARGYGTADFIGKVAATLSSESIVRGSSGVTVEECPTRAQIEAEAVKQRHVKY
jgi:hypothetical protein